MDKLNQKPRDVNYMEKSYSPKSYDFYYNCMQYKFLFFLVLMFFIVWMPMAFCQVAVLGTEDGEQADDSHGIRSGYVGFDGVD